MTSTTTTHHQRSATAATRLADLPAELIGRLLSAGLAPPDLAAANAASRLFRGAPGGRSPVEHALRERARARGHARALPTELPAGVCSWTEEFFARESVLVLASEHASPVAAGDSFSAFVDAEGGLHTCGEEKVLDEDAGAWAHRVLAATGHSGMSSVRVPMHVTSLSGVRVCSVAAGYAHLLALSDAGAVYGCGYNSRGQLGLGHTEEQRAFALVGLPVNQPVVCIVAGNVHSLALTAAGCAYTWGANWCGQLGHGDEKERREPTRIEALGGVRVGGVAAGGAHTLFLSAHGAVYSCGDCYNGQLGHGDRREQHTPRRIEKLAGVRAVHVSAGLRHSLVVDAEGGAHSFGRGRYGELGCVDLVGRPKDKRIEALAGVHAVRACAGGWSSAVLGADGSVHTFGDNRNGSTGLGASTGWRRPVPSRVQALLSECVTGCAMGTNHSLFVTAGGRVYSAGRAGAALGQGVSAADPEDQLPADLRSGDGLPMLIDGVPRVLGRW